ncbi:MAG: hypothetical protein COA42_19955 [Alteromonadaceae bacterium]|nr:MAG: hypothetical protein COA42_19955 [Alteromonadaceae bacterium]
MTMHQEYSDVLIVGAGSAGLSMACALSQTGLKITLVDKQSKTELAEAPMDGREIAMTHLSKAILQDLGVWQRFSPDDIHPLDFAIYSQAL